MGSNPTPAELVDIEQLLDTAPPPLRLLVSVLECMSNGVTVAANTPGQELVYCNPAFVRLTGYDYHEVVGRNCRHLQGEDTDPASRTAIREALSRGEPFETVILNYRKDGTPFWNALNITPLRTDGVITHFVGVQTDITGRIEMQRELERRASLDVLTGLPNRAQFTRALDRVVSATNAGEHAPYAVGFVDLDDFKSINDTRGHEAGDAVLREVASRLSGALRHSDTVARLGGDEFVFLIEGVASEVALNRPLTRLRGALLAPYDLNGELVHVGASIGVAWIHSGAPLGSEALSTADRAMYRAKHGGKNTLVVEVHSPLQPPEPAESD